MKWIKNFLLIFSFAFIISSISWNCATSYHSTSYTGGYSETQLDENVFRVNFRGNGYTSMERCVDFSLLRCAELTHLSGYQYFTIIDSKEYVQNSSYTTPTRTKTKATVYGNTIYGTSTTRGGQTFNISKPSNSNTIICFKEKPEGFSYNATILINTLRNQMTVLNGLKTFRQDKNKSLLKT